MPRWGQSSGHLDGDVVNVITCQQAARSQPGDCSASLSQNCFTEQVNVRTVTGLEQLTDSVISSEASTISDQTSRAARDVQREQWATQRQPSLPPEAIADFMYQGRRKVPDQMQEEERPETLCSGQATPSTKPTVKETGSSQNTGELLNCKKVG